jgi:hypothetical protein
MNSNFKPLQDVSRVGGTSFHQDIIFATPNELRHILDEPAYEFNTGNEKTNMEWYIQMPDGNAFTVYDYKEYKPLHPNGQVEWHIGGHDRFTTHLAKVLLEEALQQAKDELHRGLSIGFKYKMRAQF